MKIETLEIAGLIPAMQALRLPFSKEPRSRTHLNEDYLHHQWRDLGKELWFYDFDRSDQMHKTDLELASKLVKAGDEHAKVLRGIVVWVKITAPIYLYRELETYRVGRERLSSESTMHIDCKGLSGEELQKAKAEISMGKEQTTIDMVSYQALRRIYFQRRHHRLPEWHTLCEWIETLPFAKELITIEK